MINNNNLNRSLNRHQLHRQLFLKQREQRSTLRLPNRVSRALQHNIEISRDPSLIHHRPIHPAQHR